MPIIFCLTEKSNVMIRYLFIPLFISAFSSMLAQTEAIAHRGFWQCDGSAQNSVTALDRAFEAGVYGSEFDVLMTKDGVLVVNHDDVFQGFDIQESLYSEIKNLSLPNGEILPTLDEYLRRGKELGDVQLILELKPLKTAKAELEAVSKTLALVRKMELESFVDYISFSLNICKELKKQDTETVIFYLGGDLSPKEIADLGFTGIDYHHDILINKHPEWIEDAKQLGLLVNTWTVNDEDKMKLLIDKNVDYITTDKPLLLLDLLER